MPSSKAHGILLRCRGSNLKLKLQRTISHTLKFSYFTEWRLLQFRIFVSCFSRTATYVCRYSQRYKLYVSWNNFFAVLFSNKETVIREIQLVWHVGVETCRIYLVFSTVNILKFRSYRTDI
jgi:hypothetical protein